MRCVNLQGTQMGYQLIFLYHLIKFIRLAFHKYSE